MEARQPDVQFAFEHELAGRAPRRARHAVAALLEGAGDSMATRVLWTVSELVTNVIMHSHDGGVVKAWLSRPDGRVRVEVEDHSSTLPVAPSGVSPGSYGLHVVERASDAWGVELTRFGKVVWAEFARTR